MGQRLISQQAAADYLGVDVSTIRRWIATGKITAYRVGAKHIRVDSDSLDAMMTPLGPAAQRTPAGRVSRGRS